MKVVVSDLALGDLDQIENWYFHQGEHLPDMFYDDFEELLVFISENPNSGRRLHKDYRIYQMERFPHLVICRLNSGVIQVLQVLHPKQHPNLRLKRTK